MRNRALRKKGSVFLKLGRCFDSSLNPPDQLNAARPPHDIRLHIGRAQGINSEEALTNLWQHLSAHSIRSDQPFAWCRTILELY